MDKTRIMNQDRSHQLGHQWLRGSATQVVLVVAAVVALLFLGRFILRMTNTYNRKKKAQMGKYAITNGTTTPLSREDGSDWCMLDDLEAQAPHRSDTDDTVLDEFPDPNAIMEAVCCTDEALETGAGHGVEQRQDQIRRTLSGSNRSRDGHGGVEREESECLSTISEIRVSDISHHVVHEEEDVESGWGSLPSSGGSPEAESSEPSSMRQRLVSILRGALSIDLTTAVRAMRLATHCSLSSSKDNTDLKRDRVLGTGKYGRVTLVWHELGPFAIKELTQDAGKNERLSAQNEMDVIIRLKDHPNIIGVFALDDTLPTMPILMEPGGGDMFDVVCHTEISMRAKIKLLHDAACGLDHMHDNGMVHRDVKASNIIVVGGPSERTLKGAVADFGLTCDAGIVTPKMAGTPGYMAPELLRSASEAAPSMDMFSFGVLMLLIFVRPELREANMFSHSALLTEEEAIELDAFFDGEDPEGQLRLECKITERTLTDGSFQDIMLVPQNLQETVPSAEDVCEWLGRCLSPNRDARPCMESVADMLANLFDTAAA